jgi:Ca2+/H+ antiporter
MAPILDKQLTASTSIKKYLSAAFCFAVLLVIMYLPFLIFHLNTRKNDFSAVYLWSAAARNGLNPYVDDLTRLERQFNLDVNGNHQANYPPPLIVAFEPITLLSPTTAYWVWFCISVLALTTALALLVGRQVFYSQRWRCSMSL